MAVIVGRCWPEAHDLAICLSLPDGFVAEEVSDSGSYEALTCTACQRVHLVNPASLMALTRIQPRLLARSASYPTEAPRWLGD
jgi:hypothetical protein